MGSSVLVLSLGIWLVLTVAAPKSTDGPDAKIAMVAVLVPSSLSSQAQAGEQTYNTNCATCHGTNAAGQEGLAPPLVHKIYEPDHHGDESFQRAVAVGVREHHWRFGNMPAIGGLSRNEVTRIVTYVRELQRANGIH